MVKKSFWTMAIPSPHTIKTAEPTSYRFRNNIAKKIATILGSLFVLFAVASCAGPRPVQEYSTARTALKAAQEHSAPSLAPGFWHKAEEYYRKGKKKFENFENREAKKLFDLTVQFAERAENTARLKKFRTGESAP